ncbi:hypothetical protein C8J57DRAFT_1245438 [Mycena rebaudengoi]|nr:hypothetical protein C8J57DRAFT_1245438 [Mycena rebaudengoi]
MVTTGSQLAPYFTDQRPVHTTEDEEEQLSTFTNYGYEQFTNTWIGQPPVNFRAPRNHYDIQKMRDFCDYMASGRESDPTTGDRFQYVVVHDEAIVASNQRAQAGKFSIKRDYDSVLAISSAFPVTQTDVELYTIPNFKKGLQGSTHLKLRFAGAKNRAGDLHLPLKLAARRQRAGRFFGTRRRIFGPSDPGSIENYLLFLGL